MAYDQEREGSRPPQYFSHPLWMRRECDAAPEYRESESSRTPHATDVRYDLPAVWPASLFVIYPAGGHLIFNTDEAFLIDEDFLQHFRWDPVER